MRKPCAIIALAGMLVGSPIARADDHLVTQGTVDARLADAASQRARNLASCSKESLGSLGNRPMKASLELVSPVSGMAGIISFVLSELQENARGATRAHYP